MFSMAIARFCLLSLLLTLASCQKSARPEQAQGRTLGLLTPLLLGTVSRPFYDVPVRPISGVGGSAGSNTQSDPIDQFYGGGAYPNYGYRPNYGTSYGYPNYGSGYGYPGFGQNYFGGYGSNYHRPYPGYNYAGYGFQRPIQYPGSYYGGVGLGSGYRPNYGSYYPTSSYYGGAATAAAAPAAPLNPGTTAGTQLSTEQAAQLAGLLGQALGSSLRPLLANGGGAAAGAGTGVGANSQALGSLLGLLG